MSVGTSSLTRFAGRITDLSVAERRALFDRSTSSNAEVRAATATIIEQVRTGGDAALRALAEQFDRVTLESIEVDRAERRASLDRLDPSLRRAMERSARNLAAVHAASLPRASSTEPEPGLTIVRRPDPLTRVGVYAPGGRAAYPSSVLMAAVPARVAGVREVFVCSPPDASGLPAPTVLAAAEIAGVDRVFAIGGAGAIAALAFGTATVPRVDRIVGPGNAWVAEAKLQVCGQVGIDSPAGPSELCVIADDTVDPSSVALELLGQAEHDPAACVVLVAIGERVAENVTTELAARLGDQPRRSIIEQALRNGGATLTAESREEAVDFANEYAPEHLALMMTDATSLIGRVLNAGTVFVGPASSVAFGDYMSGANHVLPTGGLARSYSGLSTADFFRWTTIQTATPLAAGALAGDVALFAEAEGLPGHAVAARRAGETS